MPSEVRGSGYHPDDIGPIHYAPLTEHDYKFRKEWSMHVGTAMRQVLAGMRQDAPMPRLVYE